MTDMGVVFGVQCVCAGQVYRPGAEITPGCPVHDRAVPRLSATKAPLLRPPSCPAKFKEHRDNPPEPTKDMLFGSLVHKVLLGVGDDYAILDPLVHGLKRDGSLADSPRSTQTWKDAEAKAIADGKIPVHVDDYAKAEAMVEKVLVHRWAGPLFAEGGEPEFALRFVDPETGVLLTGRGDWLTMQNGRVILVDYKTAATANPLVWARKAADFGYEIQGAWYKSLAAMLGIDDDPIVRFVLQEKEPPYLVSVVDLDSEALLVGAQRMREAIDIYHQCFTWDEWPGYEEQIFTVSLPPWATRTDTIEGS